MRAQSRVFGCVWKLCTRRLAFVLRDVWIRPSSINFCSSINHRNKYLTSKREFETLCPFVSKQLKVIVRDKTKYTKSISIYFIKVSTLYMLWKFLSSTLKKNHTVLSFLVGNDHIDWPPIVIVIHQKYFPVFPVFPTIPVFGRKMIILIDRQQWLQSRRSISQPVTFPPPHLITLGKKREKYHFVCKHSELVIGRNNETVTFFDHTSAYNEMKIKNHK